jgi:hypothetical protein
MYVGQAIYLLIRLVGIQVPGTGTPSCASQAGRREGQDQPMHYRRQNKMTGAAESRPFTRCSETNPSLSHCGNLWVLSKSQYLGISCPKALFLETVVLTVLNSPFFLRLWLLVRKAGCNTTDPVWQHLETLHMITIFLLISFHLPSGFRVMQYQPGPRGGASEPPLLFLLPQVRLKVFFRWPLCWHLGQREGGPRWEAQLG